MDNIIDLTGIEEPAGMYGDDTDDSDVEFVQHVRMVVDVSQDDDDDDMVRVPSPVRPRQNFNRFGSGKKVERRSVPVSSKSGGALPGCSSIFFYATAHSSLNFVQVPCPSTYGDVLEAISSQVGVAFQASKEDGTVITQEMYGLPAADLSLETLTVQLASNAPGSGTKTGFKRSRDDAKLGGARRRKSKSRSRSNSKLKLKRRSRSKSKSRVHHARK